MAVLVFPNDFYLVGVTPQSGQFDLDRITRHWKTNGATESEVLSCPTLPAKGSPHPIFPFMFVTDRQASETGSGACALDINYAGSFLADPNNPNNPLLPPARNENDDEVATASSKKLNSGIVLTENATAQYYAPTTSKSFFTYLGKATGGFAPDPTDDIRIITLTIGDTSFSATGPIATLINNLFTTQIVSTLRAPEVVAGKYWQNVSKKTKTLFPWIFSITPGNYLLLYAGGEGYTVNNVLTLNDGMGHTATIKVLTLGIGGSIVTFSTLTNTFNSTTGVLTGFGGSGTGAGFTNFHI